MERSEAPDNTTESYSNELQLRELERGIIHDLTTDVSFGDIGNLLCQRIQAIVPDVKVSVCRIVNDRMVPWAAPDFHPEYGAYFDGMEIGEGVASCGTAAYRRQPVMVEDIETHPFWQPHKHVMLPHGLRSCWTYPILRHDGSVVGTFAFYFQQAHAPDPWLERIAETSLHLCLLAVEREESQNRIWHFTQFDALTGLPNLHHLNSVLDKPPYYSVVSQTGILHISVDRFGDINTAFGYHTGDQLLIELAQRIQYCLPENGFLARGDSDNFVALIPNADDNALAALAQTLLETVFNPVWVDGERIKLSVSIGGCLYDSVTDMRDYKLIDARNAAQQARREGGGRYAPFSVTTNDMGKAKQRISLAQTLHDAILADELHLVYQPQIGKDGVLSGVEALARWHHSEQGNVPPDVFIPIAIEFGYIDILSCWLIREACRQVAQWRQAGVHVPKVAVNLSPINFQDSNLPQYIENILAQYELPGQVLVIEITEDMLMGVSAKVIHVMERIRALGVGLSVDDFGTGFSSLSSLINLPITEFKIDKSFIQQLEHDEKAQSLAEVILGIGRSLDIHVVAEGIESEKQKQFLLDKGTPVIQGYFYSPPLNPEQFVEAFTKGWSDT